MFSTKPTAPIGLIGNDIQGSLAPEIHMREGEQQGLRHVYRLIDLTRLGLGTEALPDLITAAERAGFDGLAITHPCKQAVIPYLTDLSDDALQLKAVNTIVFKNGRRFGHNTDWFGFAESFRRQMGDLPHRNVVQRCRRCRRRGRTCCPHGRSR
jgi:shikimate dehydrogenase